jgi:hypothetical protein
MKSLQGTQNSPAARIEKHILTDDSVSYWLRNSFKGAISRDPVDALDDAQLLTSTLYARTLGAMSQGAQFNPAITSLMLIQHADALSNHVKACRTPSCTDAQFRLKRELSDLILQLHRIAREIHPTHLESENQVDNRQGVLANPAHH